MYYGYHEEGDKCPSCKKGNLAYRSKHEGERSCSCHINPPCAYCTNQELFCNECNWVDESEPETYKATEFPGLSQMVHKPKPFDRTKIDYRSTGHSSSTMRKYGVYPPGTSKAEVENEVKGTFGGRFTRFGGGEFEYIAYTD